MGFGMRKEVYTRKKKAFAKIKNFYQAEIHKTDYDSKSIKSNQISERLKFRIKLKIIQERRKSNSSENCSYINYNGNYWDSNLFWIPKL
jgi:hypothetical protein